MIDPARNLAVDLTAMADDELVALARASLAEVRLRMPNLDVGPEQGALDAAERARIIHQANEREMAKLRASERSRLALEAAEQARAQYAGREAEIVRERADRAGKEAREATVRAEAANRSWLRRAAELVGHEPADISLMLADTRYGRRVLINKGSEQFSKEHLSDWNLGTRKIKTKRDLIGRKLDLAAFSADFAGQQTSVIKIIGIEQDWTA